MVMQTTHARCAKIATKKCKEALVAQMFNKGFYFLTICVCGFLWLQV
jgi:hypothetical protein